MNIRMKRKFFIPVLALLVTALLASAGCEAAEEQSSPSPATTPLSSTQVPNVPLDLYLYGKQDRPTVIPANMINASRDVSIVSLDAWGASVEEDFALGLRVTFTSTSDSSEVYDEIKLDEEGWKKLSGNTIYLVHGSGPAARALKTAISNNDFKPYDDTEALQAVATLPEGDSTKQAAVAIAKPGKNLINYLTRDVDPEAIKTINLILKLVRLKIVAAGLYSPQQIDIAQVAEDMESNGEINKLDLGLVIFIKSGLLGFIVEPAVKKFLTEQDFTETSIGELTVYQGYWDAGEGQKVPVFVRIKGNRIFAAVSGQESYAKTLITSVRTD